MSGEARFGHGFEVDLEVDVAVVGGGPAGVAAALAAVNRGARVLLVDRSPALGGNVANAHVHTICGLYRAAEEGEPTFANPGLAAAFANALERAGGAGAIERAGKVYVLPIVPRVFRELAERACSAAAGLALRQASALVAAKAVSADLWQLELSTGERVTARVAIDSSGDGDLAALCGADVERAAPEELQHPSYIAELDGVDEGSLEGFERMKVTVSLAKAARDGALPPGCDSVLVRPGGAPGRAFLTLNLAKPDPRAFDPLDPAQRDALAAQAADRVTALVAFLCETRAGFRRARIASLPERIGVREGRRVLGRAVIDEAHVLEGVQSADEVAVSTWPIELWHDSSRASFSHVAGASSIPLAALVSRSHPGLGVAGRCMSATHEAHGALRVIGTALATGEAIGLAAALAVDAGKLLASVDAGAVLAERERARGRIEATFAAAGRR